MKQFKVKVNGKEYMVEVEEISSNNETLSSSPSVGKSQPETQPEKNQPAQKEVIQVKPEAKTAPAQSQGEGEEVKAPMPGKVLKINVKEGDSVNEGDTVLILEAMKMENEIVADTSGKVKKVSVSVNDMVETDDTLMIIG